MTAGYVGNRHPRLGCFGQNRQLLVQRVTPATLDAGKNFDSINTRHSRMTRLTPSSSLCSYVRSKWGPLQDRSAFFKSAGTSCTTPPEIFFCDTDELTGFGTSETKRKHHPTG